QLGAKRSGMLDHRESPDAILRPPNTPLHLSAASLPSVTRLAAGERRRIARLQSTRTRPKSRLICVVALSAPLFFLWVTAKIRSWGWGAMEAGWVPWANLILGLIALYLLVTPFVIAFRFRKTENRNTENNFEHLVL